MFSTLLQRKETQRHRGHGGKLFRAALLASAGFDVAQHSLLVGVMAVDGNPKPTGICNNGDSWVVEMNRTVIFHLIFHLISFGSKAAERD